MKHSIDHIITTYKASVFKICLGFANSPMEAEDLLQEVFINVWKGLKSFRADANMKTWIYRIAANTCMLSLRKYKFKTTSIDQLNEATYLSNDSLALDHRVEALYRFIQQLPERDKTIILLYLDQLSHKEIAQVIGITPNNVGVKINRIKKQLKNKFKTNE